MPFLDELSASRARACLTLLVLSLAAFLPGFATMPPMDRDEPRFAQASKQMLETGDFVDIRFQGEARHKKPVGVYWLQAAAVEAGAAVGVSDPRRTLWLYRLPSLAGAVASVLATFWAALAVTTRRGALVAAALSSVTLLLGVEARLATTDALVTATVVLAMGALARAFLAELAATHGGGFVEAAVFWTALAAGVLLKGPITPFIVVLAAVVLSVRVGSARWLLRLRPFAGVLWCVVLAAPWFALIMARTGGRFVADSLGDDLVAKVVSGRELHGAWPGAYLLAFWLTAWPLAAFAALATPSVVRRRREPAVAVMLAWLAPAWIVFECVPTKLPHYVLPLYPAIAILAASAIEAGEAHARSWWRRLAYAAVPMGAAAVVVGARLAAQRIGTHLPWEAWTVGGVATALAVVAAVAGWRGRTEAAVALSVGAGLAVSLFAFAVVLSGPAASPIDVSRRLVAAAVDALGPACPAPALASAGDREPSLVFLAGTQLRLLEAAQAGAFLRDGECRAAFVEASEEATFRSSLGDAPGVREVRRIGGVNINSGKALDIGVFVRQSGGHDPD